MALLKSHVTPNATGTYWKITHESIDRVNLLATWTLSLFVDKDHSDSKKTSLDDKSFIKKCSKEDLQGDLTALGYAFIKSRNDADLAGSTDA